MKDSQYQVFTVLFGRSRLWALSVLAGVACSTTQGGVSNDVETGGTAASTQQTGGTSASNQSSTSGGLGLNGGTSSSKPQTSMNLATGGINAGGAATGGTSTKPTSTSGVAAGGFASGGAMAGGTSNRLTTTAGAGQGTGGTATGNGTGGVTSSGGGGTSNGGASAGGTTARPTATGGVAGNGTSGVTAGGTGVTDSVTRTTSTFEFKHYPIQTNSDGVWNGSTTPGTTATATTYNTVILENGYLRVTLLPDYGGRILSLLHKPTNRELLYQNPVGTPYLMQQDIFYYDYLVIMGGIFPSFPEPEHGKYWNQPYAFKVVSESKEAITVRMSRQDDRNLASGVPTKYDVGRTDVLVDLDVTLRAGSTSLELSTKLTNTQSKSVAKFEYWTVTTLAPGSTPGKTAIPLNTRIMAAMDKVHLLESSWSWFASAEERVSGEVFKWNNLSYFKNWQDQGTAFANPDYRANWSGLMNNDNDTGILCVTDDGKTPGLKLWTFGPQSLNIDINDSTEWLRPTIEMWHGVTPEFWNRGTLSANEVRQWADNYFPTLGLEEITAASKYGAVHLSSSKSGSNTVLSAKASLTLPNQTVRTVIRLNGTTVSEQNVVVADKDATSVTASVASNTITSGALFEAEFLQGDTSLLLGKLTLQ